MVFLASFIGVPSDRWPELARAIREVQSSGYPWLSQQFQLHKVGAPRSDSVGKELPLAGAVAPRMGGSLASGSGRCTPRAVDIVAVKCTWSVRLADATNAFWTQLGRIHKGITPPSDDAYCVDVSVGVSVRASVGMNVSVSLRAGVSVSICAGVRLCVLLRRDVARCGASWWERVLRDVTSCNIGYGVLVCGVVGHVGIG